MSSSLMPSGTSVEDVRERQRIGAHDDTDRHRFALGHVFVAVNAPVFAGRDIKPDAFFVVDHHAVSAAVDPSGVGITGYVEAASTDVAPAVVRVPQWRGKPGDVDVVAFQHVFEHRPVVDDLVGTGFMFLVWVL